MDMEKYMDMLNLQAQNNNINYQANKKYNKIHIPQCPSDMRSIDEKLYNIHQIKADLFPILSPVLLDGQQFQMVIDELSDDEIIFLYQQSSNIITKLKPRFLIGMLGSQFSSYIRKLKLKDDLDNGVDFGIQMFGSLNEIIEKQFRKSEYLTQDKFTSKKTNLNVNELRNKRLSFYESNIKMMDNKKGESSYQCKKSEIIQVKNNLSNWFTKHNNSLLYTIKTGNGSGYRPFSENDCITEFIHHGIAGIESSLKKYTIIDINNYISELRELLNIKDKPRAERFTLFRYAISSWYSCYKINFGNSIWDNILQYHFQFVTEDRFLRDEHIIQLNDFINCIIDILMIFIE